MQDHQCPQGWCIESLGKLAEWGSGGTPKRTNANYYGGDIPWLKIGDLTDGPVRAAEIHITEKGLRNSTAELLPPETILLAMYGSIGKLGIAKITCATNQAIAYCHPYKGAIQQRFLFFGLKFLRSKLLSLGRGGTQQNISQTLLKRATLPVAPINEQHRIVEKIDTLFARLDKGEAALREVQQGLARYRQSVLKAAVTGELTREWREQNAGNLEHGRDLLQRILDTRRANWQGRGQYVEPAAPDTTDLPELPEGWVWASVEQVTQVFRNGLSRKPQVEPNPYPILRISAVRSMNVALDDLRYYAPNENEDIDAFWVERGDLLFTRYNGTARLVGVCGKFRHSERVLHPDKLIKASPVRSDGLSADFLEVAWNVGTARRDIASNIKTTSGQQGIAGRDIKAASFPLPPAEEQNVIVGIVTDTMEQISAAETACQTELIRTQALRQSILKDAFAGRLVPQDPSDEPASDLLARIRAERETGNSERRRKTADKTS